MSTITFDTLKFVERLEKAGMPREQACALAEVQKEIFSEALESTRATKTDIRDVRDDLVKVECRMDGLDAKMDKAAGNYKHTSFVIESAARQSTALARLHRSPRPAASR